MPENRPYPGETPEQFQARMAQQQQQQQQQRPMTLLDDGQRTPPATLLDTGERTPPLRVSDQEMAEQEYQSQFNSTVPTSTPVRAPDNEGWDVESGAYRETQPEQEVVDEDGMIRPGYRNPSGDMQRSPTPLPEPTRPEDINQLEEPQQVTPVPEGGLEPIPEGHVTPEGGESVLTHDPHNRTGEALLDSILDDSDPVGDSDLEMNILEYGEEKGKKRTKERKENYERGYAISPLTGRPLKGGASHKRIERQNIQHAKNQRYAEYFRANIIDPKTGQIDQAKLADAPYNVRAWYETQETIRGGGVERRGGTMHSDWDKDLTPMQRKRYDRLVKKVHFGTKGEGGMHVVPHPTQKGNFIVVDEKGRPVPSNEIDRHGRMAKAERLQANKARIEAQPERYARARQVAGDRRRIIDARREFRRGNTHMGVSKMMNLPPDHPSVVDKVQQLRGNRSWFSGGKGPSDSAAYYATYFGEGESQGGKYVPGKSPREYTPSTPEQKVAFDNYNQAKGRLELLDTKRMDAQQLGQSTEALDIEILKQKSVVQQAQQNYMRYGGQGSPGTEGRMVGGGSDRADLRGQMPGHWDRLYVKGDDPWQESTTPGLYKEGGRGVYGLQRSYDEWEDPRVVAERQAKEQAAAAEQQQPNTGGVVVPPGGSGAGAENVETVRIPPGGTPETGTQGYEQLQDSGQMTGTGAYIDNTPQGEAQSIAQSQQQEAPVRDAESLVPESARDKSPEGYTPVVPGDPQQPLTPQELSSVQPYQPVVDNETGEIRYEQPTEDRIYRDRRFDANYGPRLHALRKELDSRDWGRDQSGGSWWNPMDPTGPSASEEWYSAFMSRARGIVAPNYDSLSPEEKIAADREIQRWGDRYLSRNARGNIGDRESNPNLGYPSTHWETQSPTLNRGRDPAVLNQPETDWTPDPAFGPFKEDNPLPPGPERAKRRAKGFDDMWGNVTWDPRTWFTN